MEVEGTRSEGTREEPAELFRVFEFRPDPAPAQRSCENPYPQIVPIAWRGAGIREGGVACFSPSPILPRGAAGAARPRRG
jgi:hypothetical protein